MTYELIVRPDEGGFRAVCPQLPGVAGRGETVGGALDAAIASLAAALERRQEPPPALEQIRATFGAAGRC